MYPITKGDTIGVFAPSSYVEKADIEKSSKALQERGYKVYIHPQTFRRYNQSAGTTDEKISALNDLLKNLDVKAIWCAGGGNRALHIIDHLDYKLIKKAQKPLIGFSDVTALLNAIYAHTGQMGLHAPVFKQLWKHKDLNKTLDILGGPTKKNTLTLSKKNIVKKGRSTGHMIGGNLSIFQYLPQTLPKKFWTGGILFLEDCNEELSKIDRMLLHLKRLGVFQDINGLIFGEFTDIKDTARPFGFTLDNLIAEHTHGLKIPITKNAPFGHGEN